MGGNTGNSLYEGAGEESLRLIAKDVPSIVIGGSSDPTGLDTKATRTYIRYAASDAAGAGRPGVRPRALDAHRHRGRGPVHQGPDAARAGQQLGCAAATG